MAQIRHLNLILNETKQILDEKHISIATEEPRVSVLPDGAFGQINHYTGVRRSGGGFTWVNIDNNLYYAGYKNLN